MLPAFPIEQKPEFQTSNRLRGPCWVLSLLPAIRPKRGIGHGPSSEIESVNTGRLLVPNRRPTLIQVLEILASSLACTGYYQWHIYFIEDVRKAISGRQHPRQMLPSALVVVPCFHRVVPPNLGRKDTPGEIELGNLPR